ncbi:hypothetical protein Barb4_02953 [Bacteroidales bacterium Barb4]|nr:hypothetical protein Barb4_02953 [Bacteroidales bacterium Barb4]
MPHFLCLCNVIVYWAVRKRYGELRRNDSGTAFANLVPSFADEGIRLGDEGIRLSDEGIRLSDEGLV